MMKGMMEMMDGKGMGKMCGKPMGMGMDLGMMGSGCDPSLFMAGACGGCGMMTDTPALENGPMPMLGMPMPMLGP